MSEFDSQWVQNLSEIEQKSAKRNYYYYGIDLEKKRERIDDERKKHNAFAENGWNLAQNIGHFSRSKKVD